MSNKYPWHRAQGDDGMTGIYPDMGTAVTRQPPHSFHYQAQGELQ